MDPLQRLIDRLRDARPGADVGRGVPLAAGMPTVRVSRPDGSALWVAACDPPPPERLTPAGEIRRTSRPYLTLEGLLDLEGAVRHCLRLLDGDAP